MDKKQKFKEKQKDSAGHIPSFEEIQEKEVRVDLANGPDKHVELEVDTGTGEIVGLSHELPEMANKEALLKLLEDKYEPLEAIVNSHPDKLQRILDDVQADEILRDRCAKLEGYCEDMIAGVEDLFSGNSTVMVTWRMAMDKYYEDYEIERQL